MQTPAIKLSASANSSVQSPAPKTTEEAARQFESLLIAQMLKSARESGWKSDDSQDADSETSTMLDLSEQQFAQMLAQFHRRRITRYRLAEIDQGLVGREGAAQHPAFGLADRRRVYGGQPGVGGGDITHL